MFSSIQGVLLRRPTVVEMFMCRLCGMASSHYADRHLCSTPVRRLIVRSREVSKPRDWVWRLSHHSENIRRPGNIAAETPAKFRADWATLNPYLAASRIRQLRVLWFSAWRPRCSAGNLISISNVRYAISLLIYNAHAICGNYCECFNYITDMTLVRQKRVASYDWLL